MSTKPTFDLQDQQSLLDKNIIAALAAYLQLKPSALDGTTFEDGKAGRHMHVVLQRQTARSLAHKVPSVFYGCVTDVSSAPQLVAKAPATIEPNNAPQNGAKTVNATKGDTL